LDFDLSSDSEDVMWHVREALLRQRKGRPDAKRPAPAPLPRRWGEQVRYLAEAEREEKQDAAKSKAA
jgi:hypothetical protein